MGGGASVAASRLQGRIPLIRRGGFRRGTGISERIRKPEVECLALCRRWLTGRVTAKAVSELAVTLRPSGWWPELVLEGQTLMSLTVWARTAKRIRRPLLRDWRAAE